MIVLAGSFRIGAGMRGAAQKALEAMVLASRAEPGCRAYSFAFDALDDHCVRVFEAFDDAAALEAHRASAHMAAFLTVREAFDFHDRAMVEYDVAGARDI
jgi:quinol monooxygenase YgiN